MILNRQRAVRVSPVALGRFLSKVQQTLKLGPDSVAVCLVEDREIARLNKLYRGKRGPTDVLSFPTTNQHLQLQRGSGKNGQGQFLGDIAISPAAARRNARYIDRTIQQELRILILHGVLHLMGYDHEMDHGEMERKETKLRRQLRLEP
jgi:probable rRNA maturation factor